MSILGMSGFESGDSSMDRILVVSGAPAYSTSVLPPLSPSARSLLINGDSIRVPWYKDEASTRYEPSSGEFWFHFQAQISAITSSASLGYVGVGSNSTEFITISWQNSTGKVTLRVNGSVVATTTTYAVSIGEYKRFIVHVSSVSIGGVIKVYIDGNLTSGSEIINYTLVSSLSGVGTGKPNEFFINNTSTGGGAYNLYIDDLWAMDPADSTGATDPTLYKDSGIRGHVVNGNGTSQQWTSSSGSAYTTIDEIPPSDADYISASSVGLKSTFTKAPVLSSAERIAAVKVLARVNQSDTSAGTKVGVGFYEGVNNNQKDSIAPGDGYVTNIYNLDQDGNSWTPGKFDTAEVGVVSVA